MTDTTPDATADARLQAATQYDSILEALAACELDWGRLTELRDDREAADSPEEWAAQNPADAAELAELESAAGDCESEDDARERAMEGALSAEVRSGWGAVGKALAPSEFRILLCTGGPAVQIVGDLDAHNQPESARLEYQDWFTPWTEYGPARSSVLVRFASLFYFGE
jgi:hypothetical protein